MEQVNFNCEMYMYGLNLLMLVVMYIMFYNFTAGSTLEAMTLAVERSVVVLIGMFQKYKDSPS